MVAWTDSELPMSKRLPVPVIQPKASDVVTGGFGGFGFETLKWLIHQGAEQVAVFSRSGPLSQESKQFLVQCDAKGVRVLVEKVDISDLEQLLPALARIKKELYPV